MDFKQLFSTIFPGASLISPIQSPNLDFAPREIERKVAMKAILILAPMLLALATSLPQKTQEDFGLPELHKIKTATLSPSYSCQSEEQRHQQINTHSLYLSDFSRRTGQHELRLNGACDSRGYFESMSGGGTGVIADLGEIPLENVTAHLMFYKQNITPSDLCTKFMSRAFVQAGHTYAVLASSSEVRAVFVFTVTGYIPNKRVDLNYVVKDYQVFELKTQSPGFSWEKENTM
ncbi:MAG TPA: hypothetical protein VH724_16030 [Candidatus Angelobacter sp.]|jgi:hypothetical protein|nr:hypothetical protein [Candidatus Angelobacter sp.]